MKNLNNQHTQVRIAQLYSLNGTQLRDLSFLFHHQMAKREYFLISLLFSQTTQLK